MTGVQAKTEQYCYCGLWEEDPKHFERRGIPRGVCGMCDSCGAPGHTRHYPGPVPVTGSWCDTCYGQLSSVPFGHVVLYGIGIVVLALVAAGLYFLLKL